MSAAASLPMTHAEIESVEIAHESPENGSMLPAPRNATSASTIAFMTLGLGSALAAYLTSLAVMYTMAYSTTLGAWALVTIFSIWAPVGLISVLAASGRGEFD